MGVSPVCLLNVRMKYFLENLLDVWIVFHIFAAQMPMCDCDEVSKIINNHSIMISKYLYYFIMSI